MPKYDYIIAGGGCAGLSLLQNLLHNKATAHKKILIIEADTKQQNDRTWCFWQDKYQKNWYDALVCKTWDNLVFFGDDGFEKTLDIEPYTYKMIQALDFYNYFKKIIPQHTNVTYKSLSIDVFFEKNGNCYAQTTDNQVFESEYIFTSIRKKDEITTLKRPKDIWYLQHFKGWVIETNQDTFDDNTALFMDFRLPQTDREAHFGYVLPQNKRQALVEYTVFSDNILNTEIYDETLRTYITETLQIEAKNYTIAHQEFGIIPMTNAAFDLKSTSKKIINIGTAGGYSKPSTGYTFMRIQVLCAQVVAQLAAQKPVKTTPTNALFMAYDSIFLDVFDKNRVAPKTVFTHLFKKNKAGLVLRFLDEKTTMAQNLKIMSSVPIVPFVKAAMRWIIQ